MVRKSAAGEKKARAAYCPPKLTQKTEIAKKASKSEKNENRQISPGGVLRTLKKNKDGFCARDRRWNKWDGGQGPKV